MAANFIMYYLASDFFQVFFFFSIRQPELLLLTWQKLKMPILADIVPVYCHKSIIFKVSKLSSGFLGDGIIFNIFQVYDLKST